MERVAGRRPPRLGLRRAVAVDRAAGGVDEPTHAGPARRLQQRQMAGHVRALEASGSRSNAVPSRARLVQHDVHAVTASRQTRGRRRPPRRIGSEPPLAPTRCAPRRGWPACPWRSCRDHHGLLHRQEGLCQVRADEAGDACDQPASGFRPETALDVIEWTHLISPCPRRLTGSVPSSKRPRLPLGRQDL